MTESAIQTRRGALGALAGGMLATTAIASGSTEPAKARAATVILVRHAEKQVDGSDDPALTDVGRRRAEALAALVQAAGVTRIYTTEYRRTRATVAPAAAALGLAVERYEARGSKAFAASLAQMKNGACVLAAGHSNTVPAIVKALGGKLQGLDQRGYLDESEYDRVIILTLHAPGDEFMVAVRTLDLRMAVGE